MVRRFVLLFFIPIFAWSTIAQAEDVDIPRMTEALIRHDLASDKTYIGANRNFRFFVTVGGADLSNDAIQRLADTGVQFFPGSQWHQGADMRLDIGVPTLKGDGNYEVSYGCYCGPLCASSDRAVMTHDAGGWHVLKSELLTISLNESDVSLR